MARVPDAFFYGFTGIINHRFLTNQIARTISVILQWSIIAEGSLIPILITHDFDILSGEFVRHKSIRVLECCVTRISFVIS